MSETFITPVEAGMPAPIHNAPGVLPEAPAQGIRVGSLLWAGIVAIAGVMMILIPVLGLVQLPMLFISLIGVLGLVLIGAAVVSAFRKH